MGNSGSAASSSLRGPGSDLEDPEVMLGQSKLCPTIVGRHGLPLNSKSLAYESTRGLLAIGSAEGAVKVRGRMGYEEIISTAGGTISSSGSSTLRGGGIAFLEFICNGSRLFSVSSDSGIVFWNVEESTMEESKSDGKPVFALHGVVPSHWTSGRVTAVAEYASPGHEHMPYLFVATDDNVVHVFNTDKCLESNYSFSLHGLGVPSDAEESQDIVSLCSNVLHPDKILVGLECRKVLLVDVSKKKTKQSYEILAENSLRGVSLTSLTWSADSRHIACGLSDGSISIFYMTGQSGHRYWINPDSLRSEVGAKVHCSPVRHLFWLEDSDEKSRLVVVGASQESDKDAVHLLAINDTRPKKKGSIALPKMSSPSVKAEDIAVLKSMLAGEGAEILSAVVAKAEDESVSSFELVTLEGKPYHGIYPTLHTYTLDTRQDMSLGSLPYDFQQRQITAIHSVSIPTAAALKLAERCADSEPPNSSILNELWDTLPHLNEATSVSQDKVPQTVHLLVTAQENSVICLWILPPDKDAGARAGPTLVHRFEAETVLKSAAEQSGQEYSWPSTVTSLEFCPVERYLVVGMSNGFVAMFQYGNGSDKAGRPDAFPRLAMVCTAHGTAVNHLLLASNHKSLISADHGGIVSLTDLETEENNLLVIEFALDLDAECPVAGLCAADLPLNGRVAPSVLVIRSSGLIDVFDLTTSQKYAIIKIPKLMNLDGGKVLVALFAGRKRLCLQSTKVDQEPFKLLPVPTTAVFAAQQASLECSTENQASQSENSASNNIVAPTDLAGGEVSGDLVPVETPPEQIPPQEDVLKEKDVQNDQERRISALDDGSTSRTRSIDFSVAQQVEVECPPGALGLRLLKGPPYCIIQGFNFIPGKVNVFERHPDITPGYVIIALDGQDVTSWPVGDTTKWLAENNDRTRRIRFADGRSLIRECAALAEKNERKLIQNTPGSSPANSPSQRTKPSSPTTENQQFTVTLQIPKPEDSLENNSVDMICVAGTLFCCGTLQRCTTTDAIPSDSTELPLEQYELQYKVLSHGAAPVQCADILLLQNNESKQEGLYLVHLDKNGDLGIASVPTLRSVFPQELNLAKLNLSGQTRLALISNLELLLITEYQEIVRIGLLKRDLASSTNEKAVKEPQQAAETSQPTFSAPAIKSEEGVANRTPELAVPAMAKRESHKGKFKKFFQSFSPVSAPDLPTSALKDMKAMFEESNPELERRQLLEGSKSNSAADKGSEASTTEQTQSSIAGLTDTMSQLTMRVHERGDRLNNVLEKTQQMRHNAENFASQMKEFNQKQAAKKWWEL